MRKRNTITHHYSVANGLSWFHVRKWLLSGLFLLTFSLFAYGQQDPNKQKSDQLKNSSLPSRQVPPSRKTKLLKVKSKQQSKGKETAQTKVTVTESPKSGASTRPVIEPPKPDLRPAGKGSVLIDFSSLKLDPYNEPDLQILLNDVSFAERKEISDTLLELENVPGGLYTLTFKHPTIEDQKQELEVKINSRIRINPVFNIVRGKLIVESENGAKIFLDDKYETTILSDNEAIIFASLGEHRLQITKEGFTTYQETIFIAAGERLLKQRLEPKSLSDSEFMTGIAKK
jgi:hypothetical protein